jgi:uncharacterized protein YutE (UPF0331/DUF86 family)
MTHLIEWLDELRRHLDHLYRLRPRVSSAAELRVDLSLHNDVLFSLLTVCQLVIDIAGELSSRRGLKYADYTEAVANLAQMNLLPPETVEALEELPGFRNVLVHEYVTLDLERVIRALDDLEPVEAFAQALQKEVEQET